MLKSNYFRYKNVKSSENAQKIGSIFLENRKLLHPVRLFKPVRLLERVEYRKKENFDSKIHK